jgi:hypothetical protein
MAGKSIKPGQVVELGGIKYMALDNWGVPNCKGCDLKYLGYCDVYDCLSGVYFVKKENVNENMRKLFA